MPLPATFTISFSNFNAPGVQWCTNPPGTPCTNDGWEIVNKALAKRNEVPQLAKPAQLYKTRAGVLLTTPGNLTIGSKVIRKANLNESISLQRLGLEAQEVEGMLMMGDFVDEYLGPMLNVTV